MMIKNYRLSLLFFLILILIVIIIIFKLREYYLYNSYFDISTNPENILGEPDYYRFFSKLDMKLRKCGINPNECRKFYLDRYIPFDRKERALVKQINKDIRTMLGKQFFRIFFEQGKIKFMKVTDDIENGMPHTRENYIVFSESYFKDLLDKYTENSNFLRDKHQMNVVKLISHEQFHIFQRNNPSIMEDFYQNHWKLVKVNQDLPPTLKKVNRTNPDALPNNNWAFHIHNNKYILPLCIYNSENSLDINDTSNIYVSLLQKKNGVFEFPNLEEELKEKKLLRNLREYNDFFGYDGANNYHPQEISASLFEVAVSNSIRRRKNIEYEKYNQTGSSLAYNILLDYFSKL